MLGHAPISDTPIASLIERFLYLDGGAYVEINFDYKVCVATTEFITAPSDMPASQPFNDRLGGQGAQIYAFSCSLLGGTFIGSFAQASGEVNIVNADGAYDFMPQHYAADGRAVEIKVGRRRTDAYDDAVTVFKGIMSNWAVGEKTVRITIEDFGYKLDVPLQPSLYAGTGDAEGGSNLAGKRKPSAWGRVLNVSPPLIAASLLIYQLHNGAIEAVDAVYDRGVGLAAGTDYASYALLAAATTVSGHYDTCLSEGMVKLGSTPAGTVTADLHGDASGSGYVETTGGIVRRILSTRSKIVDPDDLYLPSFTAVEVIQPAPVGYWAGADDNTTVKDAIAQIMDGIGGVAWFRREGKLAIGVFSEPDAVPVAQLTRNDIIDDGITREPLPDSIDPPPWRWRIGYERNWTVQTDLGGSVTDERRSFCADDYRYANASATAIKADHPFAKDPDAVPAFFAAESDASDEAIRRLMLFRFARALYRIPIPALPGPGYKLNVNETIKVTYPRWDLLIGRNMRIVGIDDDANANMITITAFC